MAEIDGDLTPIIPTSTPEGVSSTPLAEENHVHDPTVSTISHSSLEASMVTFSMETPVLESPDDVHKLVELQMSKVGSDIWDQYAKQLQEQEERIREYLSSSAYRQWVQEHTLQGLVNQDMNTAVGEKNPLLNSTDYNQFLISQGFSPDRVNDEMNRFNAISLWNSTIDGVANYVQDHKNDANGSVPFIAASFAITASFIGPYTNIVDVASTDMVTVNPIQDAAAQVTSMVPSPIQESLNLVINLYAIGLINFSTAEAIDNAGKKGLPPTNWDTAVAFAKTTLAKVQGNEVNALLLAILINRSEDLGATDAERNERIDKLAAMAKAVLLSIAMAVVLKTATGKLTGDTFEALMTKKLVAQSKEDEELVTVLSPLLQYFEYLQEEARLPKEDWDNIREGVAEFYETDPSVEDLMNSTSVYSKIAQYITPFTGQG